MLPTVQFTHTRAAAVAVVVEPGSPHSTRPAFLIPSYTLLTTALLPLCRGSLRGFRLDTRRTFYRLIVPLLPQLVHLTLRWVDLTPLLRLQVNTAFYLGHG